MPPNTSLKLFILANLDSTVNQKAYFRLTCCDRPQCHLLWQTIPNSIHPPTPASSWGSSTGAGTAWGVSHKDPRVTWDRLPHHPHLHWHHLPRHLEPGQGAWVLSTLQELSFDESCLGAETLKITIDVFRHDSSHTKEVLRISPYLLCCGCQYRNLPKLSHCLGKKNHTDLKRNKIMERKGFQ